jgi:AbrB family looped-hinge helix DNA binding protein
MARIVKRDGTMVVPLRTEGAVIIPKVLREELGLHAGDLLAMTVEAGTLVLRPQLVGRLRLRGVPAASSDKLTGLLRLGGDSVKDKGRLYDK